MKVEIQRSGWQVCGDGHVNVFDACTGSQYMRQASGACAPTRGRSFHHRAPGTLRGCIWTAMSGGPDMGTATFLESVRHRGIPGGPEARPSGRGGSRVESSREEDRLLDVSSRPAYEPGVAGRVLLDSLDAEGQPEKFPEAP